MYVTNLKTGVRCTVHIKIINSYMSKRDYCSYTRFIKQITCQFQSIGKGKNFLFDTTWTLLSYNHGSHRRILNKSPIKNLCGLRVVYTTEVLDRVLLLLETEDPASHGGSKYLVWYVRPCTTPNFNDSLMIYPYHFGNLY